MGQEGGTDAEWMRLWCIRTDARLDRIEDKVDKIIWKVAGGAAVTSLIVAIGGSILTTSVT